MRAPISNQGCPDNCRIGSWNKANAGAAEGTFYGTCFLAATLILSLRDIDDPQGLTGPTVSAAK